MVRLTRAQQQARTHEHVLDAGRQVFLRRGFLAATVEEIAEAAGYTRGAVYKHFGGKEGLWQAIVEARAREHVAAVRHALELAGSYGELVAALDPSGMVADDEAARWAVTSAEYLAAVAAQPRHAAALAALQRQLDEQITELLVRHCRRLGITPAVPVPHLVVAWGALGGGLALRWAIDPTLDVAGIVADLLALLFPPPAPQPEEVTT